MTLWLNREQSAFSSDPPEWPGFSGPWDGQGCASRCCYRLAVGGAVCAHTLVFAAAGEVCVCLRLSRGVALHRLSAREERAVSETGQDDAG